jgi:hypothetical protein
LSVDVTPLAYKTHLGNSSAKAVLVLLADCGNDDGYGWPSFEKIAAKTEIAVRTVYRILECFIEIELIATVDRGKRKTLGLQLSLEKLGSDMSAEFLPAYKRAQGKDCRSDKNENVAATKNDVAATQENVAATKPLEPLIGGTVKEPSENRQARVRALPQSAGANGELMAATWLLEEIGLAGGSYDVQMLGQVIKYAARDAPCDVETAAKMLLESAKSAIERGETVNVFWFKDRKFAGGNDGTNQPGRNKARIDKNRRAVADWLAKRDVSGPWDSARADVAEMAGAGLGRVDRGVRDGSRAVSDSGGLRPGESSGRRSADLGRPEILSPAG